jgi:hypothetical protein
MGVDFVFAGYGDRPARKLRLDHTQQAACSGST